MKYYFCPNDVNSCFSTSQYETDGTYYNNKVLYINDDSTYTAGTTLTFSTNSTCSWRIIPSTQFIYGKKIKVKFGTVVNTTCTLLTGTSIKTAGDA
jgi:hypothetical protein